MVWFKFWLLFYGRIDEGTLAMAAKSCLLEFPRLILFFFFLTIKKEDTAAFILFSGSRVPQPID